MQARLHGLSSSSGLNVDSPLLQQQPQTSAGEPLAHSQPELGGAMAQTSSFLSMPPSESPGLALATPLDLGTLSFSDFSEPADLNLYPDVSLRDMLMEDCNLSPGAALDSPGASNSSSRRSSLNMEEDL